MRQAVLSKQSRYVGSQTIGDQSSDAMQVYEDESVCAVAAATSEGCGDITITLWRARTGGIVRSAQELAADVDVNIFETLMRVLMLMWIVGWLYEKVERDERLAAIKELFLWDWGILKTFWRKS